MSRAEIKPSKHMNEPEKKRKRRAGCPNAFKSFSKALDAAGVELEEISALQLKVLDKCGRHFFVTYYDNGVRWEKTQKVYNFGTKESLKKFVIDKAGVM